MKIHATQAAIWRYIINYPEYTTLTQAGVGMGKTRLICLLSLYFIRKSPSIVGAVGMRDLKQFKDSFIPEMINTCNEIGLKEGEHYSFNRTNGEFELFGHGKFLARSAEAYDSHYRSVNLSFLFMDEIDFCKQEAFLAAKGRVRVAPQIMALFSSPNGFNYIGDLYNVSQEGWELIENRNHKTYINHKLKRILVEAPSWCNPWLSQKYINDLHSTYDPRRFSQEVAGERLNLAQGSVFPEFDRNKNVKKCKQLCWSLSLR
jgi:hypothetical protein